MRAENVRDPINHHFEGMFFLLQDVLAEGVEYSTKKYALVQMSHELRAKIREELDAAVDYVGRKI